MDAKNASLGEGLPVLRAYAMREEGKDIETRGKKAALNALLEDFNAHVLPDSHQQVAVAHCDDEESAKYMAEKMLENPAVDDVIIEWYESVTGSHLGPGAVAIFYEADHR